MRLFGRKLKQTKCLMASNYCGSIYVKATVKSTFVSSSPHSSVRHIVAPCAPPWLPTHPALWLPRQQCPPGQARLVPSAAPTDRGVVYTGHPDVRHPRRPHAPSPQCRGLSPLPDRSHAGGRDPLPSPRGTGPGCPSPALRHVLEDRGEVVSCPLKFRVFRPHAGDVRLRRPLAPGRAVRVPRLTGARRRIDLCRVGP